MLLNAVVCFIIINATILLGTYLSGKPFEFSLIYNVLTPLLCAFANWGVEKAKAKL